MGPSPYTDKPVASPSQVTKSTALRLQKSPNDRLLPSTVRELGFGQGRAKKLAELASSSEMKGKTEQSAVARIRFLLLFPPPSLSP